MVDIRPIASGYLLLGPSPVPGYRGVDRDVFRPLILPEEMLPVVEKGEWTQIWPLYPPGWRQDAYRLFEENEIALGRYRDLELLTHLDVAYQIKRIIDPHLGFHEVVDCSIWRPAAIGHHPSVRDEDFLGYDVAYCGGDFFSAVRTGFFPEPEPDFAEFVPLLNRFRLFVSPENIPAYIKRYKEVVRSERKASFCVYELSLTHPPEGYT